MKYPRTTLDKVIFSVSKFLMQNKNILSQKFLIMKQSTNQCFLNN